MHTPTPTPDLVLGDTRTGYPRTCACVPTCWVTTCTRTRWGARVRVGRHAYALGGACTCWGARVRVGGCAFVFGGARTLWEVRVNVGGHAYMLGCAFVLWGARTRWEVRVRVGRCAFVFGGGARVRWGACACGRTRCVVVT
ncbi:hypothetical protein DFH94DRAFT_733519, partial [Russula ochroleuca]